jgi:hypothetical protein
MYTATIGKIILDRFREQLDQPEMTARQLFDQVFFPLFFDDERYLMVANNSKFDQAYKQKKKHPLTKEVRHTALADFHSAVDELAAHEGHLYLGGYARKTEDPTASQITDLKLPIDKESTYLTWFGAAAGIGVKGGVSLLINDTQVIDQIIEGWNIYREYMHRTPTLKPHQIDTWNGWWLTIRNREFGYDANDPLTKIPEGMLNHKDGISSLTTVPWSRLLFSIARNKTAEERLLAYIYSFGQTNTSIGFIPLMITQVNRLTDTYRLVAAESATKADFQRLYETEFGFVAACRMGAIGLRALQPKALKNYMNQYKGKITIPKTSTDEDKIKLSFYKTWITAMLDNKTLVRMARKLAQKLTTIGPADRGKTTLSAKITSVLEATSQLKLVTALTELLNDSDLRKQGDFDPTIFREVVEEVMSLPATKVPLFLTLVRFENAVQNY